jgi:class 3 adenylate cyclase
VDANGKPVPLPAEGDQRGVTFLERQGRPMTALVHNPMVFDDADLSETVLTAVRFVIEKERLRGQIQATSTDAAALPSGFVTLLMTDIEASTALLRRLGDGYGALLNDVRSIVRRAVSRGSGREIDARADEFFAVFDRPAAAVEAAVSIQRALGDRTWPEDLEVRLRIGIHSGHPTLTDVGYIGLAVHTTARVCAAAHGRREPAVSRPYRRGRVRQCVPTLDVALDQRETGFEAFEQRAKQAKRVFRVGQRREGVGVGRVLLGRGGDVAAHCP